MQSPEAIFGVEIFRAVHEEPNNELYKVPAGNRAIY